MWVSQFTFKMQDGFEFSSLKRICGELLLEIKGLGRNKALGFDVYGIRND